MKGDFTRFTFDATKHYRNVLTQQGRVQMDADNNEEGSIISHRIETEAVDLIGGCGAPLHNAGFEIKPPLGPQLFIGAGRYYVDGILCENEQTIPINAQPDLPNRAIVVLPDGTTRTIGNAPSGVYLAYLDVWLRHVTALEDRSIREVALGGPDTATRIKVAWQVRLLRLGDPDLSFNCLSQSKEFEDLKLGTTGLLRARLQPGSSSDEPCVVSPSAGFRGLENQLYRVEVHKSGTFDEATFKWSRENGSVVTDWIAVGPSSDSEADHLDLTVGNIGRDKVLRFAEGQWVELTNDSREETASLGTFVRVVRAEGEIITVDATTALPAGTINLADFAGHPKVRRWDFSDNPADMKIEQPADNDGWLKLEKGVEVKFEGGQYRSGDYWLIPARTVEPYLFTWPQDGPNNPAALPPHGIKHHYCRLALVELNDNSIINARLNTPFGDVVLPPLGRSWTVLSDCRKLFPPMTELTSLFYVGGDGQEVMPDLTQPTALFQLPQPLQVGVANGSNPVKGARVRFQIKSGAGKFSNGSNEITLTTDDHGIASVFWQLSATPDSQQAEATLLDAAGQPVHIPIRFTANLSKAAEEEPGIHIVDVRTVEPDTFLHNDTDLPVARFVHGLTVICDEALDKDTVNGKPNCFITLELPFALNGKLIGFQPIILAGQVTASDKTIRWVPTVDARDWLISSFSQLVESFKLTRVLARLTLKGRFIWGNKVIAGVSRQLYLDGEAFGFFPPSGPVITDDSILIDGTLPILIPPFLPSNIELRLPSGDKRRGGDFEMWFWLTPAQLPPPRPPLQITKLSFVGSANPIIGLDRSDFLAPFPPSILLSANKRIRTIEVTFNRSIGSPDSQNLFVDQLTGLPPTKRIVGSVELAPDKSVAILTFNQLPLQGGRYRLTVLGDAAGLQAPPVTASDGTRLDGNYDNTEGGNFVLEFDITGN